MGRELRKVPENWDHPRNNRGDFVPMYKTTFEQAASDWKANFLKWEAGERPEQYANLEFWDYAGMPPTDCGHYRPWADADATWFQVWETVSEGTPVTPPFATKEELIEYLVANGDFWDQSRRQRGYTSIECGPWNRDRATRFINDDGWFPSMIVGRDTNGAVTIETAGHVEGQ